MIERAIDIWDSSVGYSKRDPIKYFIKFLSQKIPLTLLRRLMPYSLISKEFANLKHAVLVSQRSQVWDEVLSFNLNEPITFVEFGVFEGESIRYFAAKNQHSQSKFLGLDSFEGLPEKWAGNEAGFFSTSSNLPVIADARVQFVKGWFIDTWEQVENKIIDPTPLIVHFDADLYSSTLFALIKVDGLKRDYYAIFDEFCGEESRALADYMSAFQAKVEFICKQNWRGYPEVVLCKILPYQSI